MTDALLPVLDVAVGIVVLASGLVAAWQRPSSRVGALLVLTATCWFLGTVIGALVLLHRGPMVHLHLTYPTGRPHRFRSRLVIGTAYAAAVYDGVVGDPRVAGALAALVALAALDLYLRTSGSARKAGGPALAAALAFSATLAASSINVLLDLGADLAVAAGYDLVLATIAVGLTVDLLRGRWTEATVADLVSQVTPDTDETDLQAALRRALADPALTVGYRDVDDAAWMDDAGRSFEVRPGPDQVATVVVDDGRPMAVLVHATAVLEDRTLLDGAMAAVRLAVGNARMRAAARARARQLEHARRRVVEAGDAQRLALVEELESGAERHLAAVAGHLDRASAEGAAGDLEALRAEVSAARAELRAFAQGVRPPVLESDGLAAAVTILADRAGLPVAVRVEVEGLPPAVESALYFVCAEALTNVVKHASATAVDVQVRIEDDDVLADVVDDGRGGADPRGSGLRGLADRVEALGGRLRVVDDPGSGSRVSVRLPLLGGEG